MNKKPVCFVSGASRGLGRATALCLAKASADLVLAARSREALEQVADECRAAGAEVLVCVGDVAEPDLCQRWLGETQEKFKRLDALINNAGVIGPIGPLESCDPEQWSYAIGVNLVGPFCLTRASLPLLRAGSGTILNVSTGAASQPIPSWSAYCASKAGLLHLTKVTAAEEPTLTVLAIAPGVVATEMQATIRREGPGRMPKQLADYFLQLEQTGQLEAPEVPGKVIAWLALEALRQWTGNELSYDDPQLADRLQASSLFAST